ncbi:Tm-1-like ATP-binding domain-containing protein [Breoghania sp.]|nr:Tm-1-like ATP-binding domain-containing protein [Breoghania sp.]MDJ0933010.1 Tm-1-like ATP-binding domain-containing protein [Breoghania sp.]
MFGVTTDSVTQARKHLEDRFDVAVFHAHRHPRAVDGEAR